MPLGGAGNETIGTAYVRILADGSPFAESVRRQMRQSDKEWERAGEEAGDTYSEAWLKQLQKGLQEQDKVMLDQEKVVEARAKSMTEVYQENIKKLEGSTDKHHRSLRRLSAALDENAEKWDLVGDRIGRSFGKGARNDFVNIIGVLIGRFAAFPATVLRGIGKIASGFESLQKTFVDAGGGFRGFIAAGQSLAGSFVTATAGFTALTAVVGTFVAAMSLAAGAVLALAASLSFALIGAIGAVAGALVPLGAAFGVALAGFLSMDKATKDAFKGLLDDVKGLGDAIAEEMFKGFDPEIFSGILQGFEPLARALGGAVGDVMKNITDSLASPAFTTFIETLATTLPNMIRSLGFIAENLGTTFAGMFSAGAPFIQEFLDWLVRLTLAWSDWSNSAAASKTFEGMATSLSAVMSFLGPVVDLVQELFSAGQKTGDSIFRKMGDAIQGWVDTLRANPDILRNFFEDAEKFADALGHVVVAIGKVWDALDDETTRKFAIGLFEGIANALELLGGAIKVVMKLLDFMGDDFSNLALTVGLAALAFPKFTSALGGAARGIVGFGGALLNAETRMATLGAAAGKAAGPLGIGLLINGLRDTESSLSGLQSAAGGALIGLSLGGPLGALAGAFGGVALQGYEAQKAMQQAAEEASTGKVDYDNLAASLDELSGNFTKASREAAYMSLVNNKVDDDIRRLGISVNDVTAALTGDAAATERLTALRNSAKTQNETLTASLVDMKTELQALSGDYTQTLTPAEKARSDQLKEMIANAEGTVNSNKKLLDTLDKTGLGFEKEAEKIRKMTGATTNWTAVLGNVPKEVLTRVELGNFPTTAKQIAELFHQYDIAPRRITTYLQATGVDVSEKKVRQLLRKLDEADKKKAEPEVKVDTTKAEGKLKNVNKGLDNVKAKAPAVKVDADKSKFDSKTADVKKKVDQTGRMKPTVKVTADTTDADTDLDRVKRKVDDLPSSKTITITTNYRSTGKPPKTASGGVFTGPQVRLIGEAGPEAVVPLNRPLGQVDPAVRMLSAIAQGITTIGSKGGPASNRTIDVGGITVVTPTQDPRAVAQEVINRLAVAGY